MNQNKEKRVLLTLKSKYPVDPEKSEIPIYLLADRLLIEFIPPEEAMKLDNGTVLFRPQNAADQGWATGKIVSIGDNCDTDKPIPAVLQQLGLIVRYTKTMAEEIEYEKRTLHMVRWTEVASIV